CRGGAQRAGVPDPGVLSRLLSALGAAAAGVELSVLLLAVGDAHEPCAGPCADAPAALGHVGLCRRRDDRLPGDAADQRRLHRHHDAGLQPTDAVPELDLTANDTLRLPG